MHIYPSSKNPTLQVHYSVREFLFSSEAHSVQSVAVVLHLEQGYKQDSHTLVILLKNYPSSHSNKNKMLFI